MSPFKKQCLLVKTTWWNMVPFTYFLTMLTFPRLKICMFGLCYGDCFLICESVMISPPVSGSRGVLVRAARWNGGTWHPQTIGGRYVPTATNILWDCNRLRTWAWPCSSWIDPLKMVIFHRFGTEVLWISIQWGMSSSQLVNSIIFRRGRYTTDRERLIIKYTPYMGIYCDWCGDKYNTSIYEHHT